MTDRNDWWCRLRRAGRGWGRLGLVCLCVGVMVMPACQNRRRPPPAPRQAQIVVRDVPSALRGTIGAEASLQGVQPTLVSGVGFVVGLNGTGGLTMPEQFAAHLEREMGLLGISTSNQAGGRGIAGRSPRQLLRDPNTAAVIVQAAIPPGANSGDTFDVYVRAINATSLEGGRLWTTTLRAGPPTAFGDPQAIEMGKANGPIFLNPFAEPGKVDGVQRTIGRVLDGGTITTSTVINVILDNPSHMRARQIASAVNSSFPRGPGDPEQIARGRDEQLVQVRIPFRYRERREEFIELIRHLPIDQSFPEVYARRFAQTLVNEPYMSGNMSYSLEALGERSKPFLAELYDAPELAPRLAALRAGAALNDPRAVRPLRELAKNGQGAFRTDAIALLSRIDGAPIIEETLREALSDPELSVRVEAYEGLMHRAVEVQKRRLALAHLQGRSSREVSPMITLSQLDTLSRAFVPGGGMHGVSRELIEGKFFLDRVPFGSPLIYISQQGEPRIVLFGENPELTSPMIVSAWSDRLLMASDAPGDPIRLYYRDVSDRRSMTLESVPKDIEGFIRFLARRPTANDPRPGLGLSYAEIVGLLYEIQVGRGTVAAFATENDRLLAELMRSVETQEIEMRPEAPGGDITLVSASDPRREVVDRDRSGLIRERRSLLVPINPPATDTPPSQNGPGTNQPGRPSGSRSDAGRSEAPMRRE
ncbi:MAG: flagellar basal body P-ring protein FlgI [Phycisphaerales bacterium]|nr:flagellar basal body P-ring protein FlgI [Planctomycetota bacterium]MCH8507247.1 flagellar basal body P-ring protein FlgI [Phycisphaerales bacterium]